MIASVRPCVQLLLPLYLLATLAHSQDCMRFSVESGSDTLYENGFFDGPPEPPWWIIVNYTAHLHNDCQDTLHIDSVYANSGGTPSFQISLEYST